ncbi:hypothetical protein MHYP_G00146620 [Metynnis hypsauchen]
MTPDFCTKTIDCIDVCVGLWRAVRGAALLSFSSSFYSPHMLPLNVTGRPLLEEWDPRHAETESAPLCGGPGCANLLHY